MDFDHHGCYDVKRQELQDEIVGKAHGLGGLRLRVLGFRVLGFRV